jgi:hypothetical protein
VKLLVDLLCPGDRRHLLEFDAVHEVAPGRGFHAAAFGLEVEARAVVAERVEVPSAAGRVERFQVLLGSLDRVESGLEFVHREVPLADEFFHGLAGC